MTASRHETHRYTAMSAVRQVDTAIRTGTFCLYAPPGEEPV
jgi:hypothetical protein